METEKYIGRQRKVEKGRGKHRQKENYLKG
jgi:hypothetical protein